MLLEAGAALLGIAFLVKAGMWPLGFWLPGTYAVAAPPVAAMFSIMTKVGIYAMLRLWLLLFGGEAGASAYFGGNWLLLAASRPSSSARSAPWLRRIWPDLPDSMCSCRRERCLLSSPWATRR